MKKVFLILVCLVACQMTFAGNTDNQTTEGTDFWVTFLRADADSPTVLSLAISAKEATDVTINNPYTGFTKTLHVPANTTVMDTINKADAYSSSAAMTRGITGRDLKLVVVADEALANGGRKLTCDIVNNGSCDVNLADCNVVYTLYKKKHFHEKSFLADVKVNVNLPAGAKASSVLGKNLTIEYQLPSQFCNGISTDADCYMFLALDPKNESGDDNLENNFAFITSSDAKPLKVFNNEITNDVKILTADLRSKITNYYTGAELIGYLAKELK